MRTSIKLALVGVCAGTLASVAWAQQGQRPRGAAPAGPAIQANASETATIVNRLMAFDANGDGKLTRAEITDSRLLRLFDRADANHDGIVTRDEAEKVAAQMVVGNPVGRDGPGSFGGPGEPDGFGPGGPGGSPPDRFGGPGGPDGPGGPPEFGGPGGPGGQGGPGGFGGRGRRFGGPGGPGGGPGQILPAFIQERLNLTDAQKQKVTALQQEVDRKLQAILTEDQRRQLQEMRRGPGGPGGFGSPDGPGGPGGQGGPNGRRFGGPPDGPDQM